MFTSLKVIAKKSGKNVAESAANEKKSSKSYNN
jgi:hypothetical protein